MQEGWLDKIRQVAKLIQVYHLYINVSLLDLW